MATFKVEATKIAKVWNHPNADRLDLAMVEGIDLQFVVGRDSYNVGDDVVYFPIDSVLPQDLIDFLGLTGKLSGRDKNRIRTCRLRDEISQGFVCSLETVSKYFDGGLDLGYTGTDLTTLLKVTKHEPEEIPCTWGTLTALPKGVGVYDIEGVERYKEVVELLMDVPCIITEKIEGSNAAIHIDEEDNISVCQRNHAIKESPDGEHMFWKVARNDGWIELIKSIKANLGGKTITIRGEMVGPGIQKNIYEFKHHKLLAFDLMVDGVYVDAETLLSVIDESRLVPIISIGKTLREFIGNNLISDTSNGTSILINKHREGIVIKPMVEARHNKLGRVILKKRSPVYLAEE